MSPSGAWLLLLGKPGPEPMYVAIDPAGQAHELSGSVNVLYDINDNGLMAGTTADGEPAVFFTDGRIIRLPVPFGYMQARARSLSNSGWVVGYAERTDPSTGDNISVAVRWRLDKTNVELFEQADELPSSAGLAVNDGGEAVVITVSGPDTLAHKWLPTGAVVDLVAPEFQGTYAETINRFGDVAGIAMEGTTVDTWSGYLWPGDDSPPLSLSSDGCDLYPSDLSDSWLIGTGGPPYSVSCEGQTLAAQSFRMKIR